MTVVFAHGKIPAFKPNTYFGEFVSAIVNVTAPGKAVLLGGG